ncbi:ORF6N domain-containing protein [bacterium]|nr:ORF6N domain-containing protein [bacterium]
MHKSRNVNRQGSDLARLYGVETKVLNQAVRRNIERFPSNFMFQLTKEEWTNLRSQFVTFKKDIRKYLPNAFTEQGVAMLSSVLNSERAIQINIQIMNTFVQARQFALENKELTRRLAELEHYFMELIKDNEQDKEETQQKLAEIYEALNLLMDRTRPRKIGYIKD